ncbi:MAG: PASTA domain-containing protein [Desulfobulbaceae bacterium]|uniref:beta-lactamase n=1 Tax=Candidatus Desulfobia pelagia TaxID=2841692 RepID=A0A8J6NEH9_9BACT|nr:PASTA domain-containing protein [Candidatus Desulfobia pelagia]
MGREIRDWATYTDKSKEKGKQKRRRLFLGIVLLVLVLVFYRLYQGPFFFDEEQEPEFVEPAVQSSLYDVRRKNIYDRRLNMVAASIQTSSVYVKPREFDDIAATAGVLAKLLSHEEAELLEELKTERNFTWLARNISPEKAKSIKSLDLDGVYFHDRVERVYPNWPDAPQFIGQVKDEVGLSGVEFSFNDSLLSGRHLVLTLDLELQSSLMKLLENIVEDVGYKQGGSLLVTTAGGILMDPRSGEILASAQVPSSQHFFTPALATEDKRAGVATVSVKTGGLLSIFKLAAVIDAGLRRSVESGMKEGSSKIISPRLKKVAKSAPSAPLWQLDRKKNIISPWLASIVAEAGDAHSDEGQPLLQPHMENEFFRSAGFEMGSEDTASALHVLNSFGSLVNDGRSVEPHMVLGTISDSGDLEGKDVSAASRKTFFSQEESREFRHFLEETSPSGKSFFIAESLQKSMPGNVAVAVREFDEYGGEINADNEGKTEDGSGGASILQGVSGPDQTLYDGAVLAAAPMSAPELVMLISFSQGMIDVTKPSRIEKLTKTFMQKALPVARASKKIKGKLQVPEYDHEAMLAAWQGQQGRDVTQANIQPKPVKEIMPDLHGLSIRRALRILQSIGCTVSIEGSGTVVQQHPEAGSVLVSDKCVLMARKRNQNSDTKKD